MFGDARGVERGSVLERDVCIIGGGAAGITIALELGESNLSVCVLESGGFEAERDSQDLYRGQVDSSLLGPNSDYTSRTRLRFWGGSTNHWEGLCRPLDEIDFQSRSWVPNSGWPFDRAHLDPYYERAARLLEIRPYDYRLADLKPARGRPLRFHRDVGIGTRVWHFSPPTRFGSRYREELATARNIEILLHANAVNIRSDAGASRVDSVDVASLSGNRFRVKPRFLVLAAGGIENARLLLSSHETSPAGLCNEHDLVGRYFMDHVFDLGESSAIVLAEPETALGFYNKVHFDRFLGHASLGLLALSPDLQREHALPNHGFRPLLPLRPQSDTALVRALGRTTADLSRLAGTEEEREATRPPEPFRAPLSIAAELVPDPENRVTLADEVDSLGMRRVRLRWNLTPFDEETLVRSRHVFATELGRSLRGRVRIAMSARHPAEHLRSSSHHIGTTRMHSDPKRGVVDANCRGHGMSNFFIAGSSVFPTCGQANPTFTLVALAIRLSDHLKRMVAR